MAKTVRFVHHASVLGVQYVPGALVSLPDDLAKSLIAGKRAVDPGALPPETPVYDPLPQYVTEAELTDPGSPAGAALSTTFVRVVAHGSTAGTARPTGAVSVLWIGDVEPVNMTDDDLWIGAA